MKDNFIFNNSILVKPEDLNPMGKLYGGRLLEWIDEKSALFCRCQLNYQCTIVTKAMSAIDFVSSANNGDAIEFGFKTKSVGRSSITVECVVQNKVTGDDIIRVENITFVNVDEKTLESKPHGFTMETIGSK